MKIPDSDTVILFCHQGTGIEIMRRKSVFHQFKFMDNFIKFDFLLVNELNLLFGASKAIIKEHFQQGIDIPKAIVQVCDAI